MLAAVVGADGFRRAIRRRPMKEQYEVLDAMRFDEELALAAQLTRAKKVGTTRRETASAARTVDRIA